MCISVIMNVFSFSVVCEKGKYGTNCEESCVCNGRGACDVEDGSKCFCDDGYEGEKCQYSRFLEGKRMVIFSMLYHALKQLSKF